MYLDKSILAIVTARGGSKGLPGKNTKEMNGKPLIVWTLNSIKDSCYLDETYISTDNREIANVCEDFGVPAPTLRPAELAKDETSSMDVLEHVIHIFEEQGKSFDYFILLEPTSPLRKKDDIDCMIRLAVENPNANGVISVGRVHQEHPSIIKKVDDDGYIKPYVHGLGVT